jgi:N-acyl-L-homoserine lactone synthetase
MVAGGCSSSDGMPTAAGVAALDRLSGRLLHAAPGLRVAVAATRAEREAAYRLRYEQVVQHGWAHREELPAGIERDSYDADALHIGAWDGAVLVGALRLVLPVAGRRLPVEAAFDLEVEPRGAVVEVGRLVITPAYRGDPAHRAWGALFARAWLSTRADGFAVLAGAASTRMVERLRALGLPFEVLGPAPPYWGEERHPVRLDPAHRRPRWYDDANAGSPGG